MQRRTKLVVAVTAGLLAGCGGVMPEWEQLSQQAVASGRQCERLDEQACLTTSGCELVYSACALCEAGADCPPCEAARCQPAEPAPPPRPHDTCQGLDEASCTSRSDCVADYGACIDVCVDDGDGGCLPCPSTYFGCYAAPTPPPPAHCATLSERMCNMTSGCTGIYSGQCPPCPAGARCAPCDPENFSFSHCTEDASACRPPDSDGGSWGSDGGEWKPDGGEWVDGDGGTWSGDGGWSDADAGSGASDAGAPRWP